MMKQMTTSIGKLNIQKRKNDNKFLFYSLTDELNKLDVELSYDYDITDSLQFPHITTSTLYDKNKKHHLKIHVPGFVPLQTNCAKKTWEKLMRLQSTSVGQTYYLLTKHCIGKHGRSVTVGSPLQV